MIQLRILCYTSIKVNDDLILLQRMALSSTNLNLAKGEVTNFYVLKRLSRLSLNILHSGMPKLLLASFSIVQLKYQYLCCNNDFDQDDQSHSDYKDQDKYGKANTLSPFSIFYTEKLTSPKRREFLSRTVVM